MRAINTLFTYDYKKRLAALEAITNRSNPNLEAVKNFIKEEESLLVAHQKSSSQALDAANRYLLSHDYALEIEPFTL